MEWHCGPAPARRPPCRGQGRVDGATGGAAGSLLCRSVARHRPAAGVPAALSARHWPAAMSGCRVGGRRRRPRWAAYLSRMLSRMGQFGVGKEGLRGILPLLGLSGSKPKYGGLAPPFPGARGSGPTCGPKRTSRGRRGRGCCQRPPAGCVPSGGIAPTRTRETVPSAGGYGARRIEIGRPWASAHRKRHRGEGEGAGECTGGPSRRAGVPAGRGRPHGEFARVEGQPGSLPTGQGDRQLARAAARCRAGLGRRRRRGAHCVTGGRSLESR